MKSRPRRTATSGSLALLALLVAGEVAARTGPVASAEPCEVVGASGSEEAADGRPEPTRPTARPAVPEAGAGSDELGPAADETRARQACETARERFAELFGEPVPPVRILLWDRPGYRTGLQGERAAVVWPTSRVMAARAKSAEAALPYVESQWNDVLPHEISHALLAARFFADERSGRHTGYGTPLPDWLDEGVAIWAETPRNRDARLRQARALPAERRDLLSILEMRHPGAGATAEAIRNGAAPPPDEALWAFYPQSIAALAFVYDAGGADAIAELMRRLLAAPVDASRPDPPSARDLLVDLPGLPDDFEGVVAAWNAWLAAEDPGVATAP